MTTAIRLLALVLLGCAAEGPAPTQTCGSCHGSAESPAPPSALGGFTEVGDRGVGAHQAHLQGGSLGIPVACTECHLIPAETGSPGHIDTPYPAELTWGPLATTGGAAATWDTSALTCQAYCHGSSLTGGQRTEPLWTSTASLAQCDSCHGSPPPAPHPPSAACGQCHVTSAGGSPDPDTHIDGVLQVNGDGPQACDDCHGADGDPSPPPALNGATATSDPGVGAHQVHLTSTRIADTAVNCTTCHVVPVAVDDAGHLNGTTELTFTGDAVLGGFAASYDAGTQTCTVYCHNGSPPVWTGAPLGCDGCHAFPPPSPHPASTACEGCHSSAGAGGVIANTATHIDGQLTF